MKIDSIIVHCSDSLFGDAKLIKDWHVNGNKWSDIGYHAVILNGCRATVTNFKPSDDGLIEAGRKLDFTTDIDSTEIGAHAKGFNDKAIGVCLVGKDKFTPNQIKSLFLFCKMWERIVPNIKVLSHYETPLSGGKTCPNIPMGDLRKFLASEDMFTETITKYLGEAVKV